MPEVYISRKIFDQAMDVLRSARISFTVNEADLPLSKQQLIEHIHDVRGLMCLLTDNIDEEMMRAAPQLKVISNVAAGFNNIDINAASRLGIMVTNTPDVLTETTADLAFALLIGVARRIVEADKYTRWGQYRGWELVQPHMGTDIRGKVLGIVGMGRVGRALARSAALGFNMQIIYYSKSHCQEIEKLGGRYVEFEELLRESDFISVHVPLTDRTRHMFGPQQFRMMKPTAIIINTSRGPVIDEQALADALDKNIIAGAGLDVYENEPAINSRLLKKEKNVVLLPHIGSATLETRIRMCVVAAQNMVCALRGETPPNLVRS